MKTFVGGLSFVGFVSAAIYGYGYIQNEQRLSCGHRMSCVANLKMLDSAKEQWAYDNKKGKGAPVEMPDLVGKTLYLRFPPACPDQGTYSVNAMGTNPTCSCGKSLP